MSVKREPDLPDIEGYLDKLKHRQSALTLITSSWNRRWFSINRATRQLEYFKSEQDATGPGRMKPLGSVCLCDVTAVRQYDDTSFQIESPSRTFLLRADSRAQRIVWVDALEGYVKRWKPLKVSPPLPPSSITCRCHSPAGALVSLSDMLTLQANLK
ncbi:hypothetical protein JKP88DRAFT_249636 [Tribonema minus]|uniref:PH domain-containing protein n=1 Tax=Tribonema minus TaxID=303371 RepID=A0A835YJ06_9STRA|nr:hypothetical protein JKP88DRAFT_249636 [Tribonema minus]